MIENSDCITHSWISVDDMLPDHCQYVLVCDSMGKMFVSLFITYANGCFDWCSDVRIVNRVTYWMPLPELPNLRS